LTSLALVFVCPTLSLDVGYWVVLAATLLAGNASADVQVINVNETVTGPNQAYVAVNLERSCPSGYVATSWQGSIGCMRDGETFQINSTPLSPQINPTKIMASTTVWAVGTYCSASGQLVCAKICN
jgi:hypothetical protein